MLLACQMRAIVDAAAYKHAMSDSIFQTMLGNTVTGNSAFDALADSYTFDIPTGNPDGYMDGIVDTIVGGWANIGINCDYFTRTVSRGGDNLRWLWPRRNRFYCGYQTQYTWRDENRQLCMRALDPLVIQALIGVESINGSPVSREFKQFTAALPGQQMIMANYAVDSSAISIAEIVAYLRIMAAQNDEHLLCEATITNAMPAGRRQRTTTHQFFTHFLHSNPRRSDCVPNVLHSMQDFLFYTTTILPIKYNFGVLVNDQEYLYGPCTSQARMALWCMGITAAHRADLPQIVTSDPRNPITKGNWHSFDLWLRPAGTMTPAPNHGVAWWSRGTDMLQPNNAPAAGLSYSNDLTDQARDLEILWGTWSTGAHASDLSSWGQTIRPSLRSNIFAPNGNRIVANPWPAEANIVHGSSYCYPYYNAGATDAPDRTVDAYMRRQGNMLKRAAKKFFTMYLVTLPIWLGTTLKTSEVVSQSTLAGMVEGKASIARLTSKIPGLNSRNNLFSPSLPAANRDRISWDVVSVQKYSPIPVNTMLRGLNAKVDDEVKNETAQKQKAIMDEKVQNAIISTRNKVLTESAESYIEAKASLKAMTADLDAKIKQLEKADKAMAEQEQKMRKLTEEVEKLRASIEKSDADTVKA
jgi:hypothetical protein